MLDYIINYLKFCPYLADFTLNVDYLGKDVCSAAISGASKVEVLRKYTDGDAMKKRTYALLLRLPYGIDKAENQKRRTLLENIEKWFRENNAKGILPELQEPDIAVSVSCEERETKDKVTATDCVLNLSVSIVYYSVG